MACLNAIPHARKGKKYRPTVAAVERRKEGNRMGYWTQAGYWGLVGNRWMLFVSEAEYRDYIAS